MDGDTKIEEKASFKEFMNVVINGYYELEVYLSQDKKRAESTGINTGMIDGVSGISRNWNSYWKTCGVCYLNFKPDYILHMEHFQEDVKVRILIEKSMLIYKQFIIFHNETNNLF